MEDIIEQIHQEFNIPKIATRQVLESPYKFMAHSMRNMEFKCFMMVGLGRFTLRYKGKENYMETYNKREQEKLENERRKAKEAETNS